MFTLIIVEDIKSRQMQMIKFWNKQEVQNIILNSKKIMTLNNDAKQI